MEGDVFGFQGEVVFSFLQTRRNAAVITLCELTLWFELAVED